MQYLLQNPPDWQEILTYFRGSELQNYFTRILEDNLKVLHCHFFLSIVFVLLLGFFSMYSATVINILICRLPSLCVGLSTIASVRYLFQSYFWFYSIIHFSGKLLYACKQ